MASRVEKVVLDLEDNYSKGLVRPIAATKALEAALKSLDGTNVRTSVNFNQSTREIDRVAASARDGGQEIDRFSGRLRLLADAAAVLGPGLAPIGAVAVPAVAGLANQMGLAALATGTAVVAFQGVGSALDALNKAQLEPTEANLEAARQAMEQISPAARNFVVELDDMGQRLETVRNAAARGLFPGLTEGLDASKKALPEVRNLFEQVAGAVGRLGEMTGKSLGSGEWNDFINFLSMEAPPAIEQMGRSIGSLVKGFADLWMAFAPLNRDFGDFIESSAAGFERWASSLSETQGFREFIEYVRETGPQVAETLGALANAALQIGEAVAPLGGPVLAGIEALADAIAVVADSDLGTPLFAAASALALMNRAMPAVTGGFTAIANTRARVQDTFTGAATAMERASASARSFRTDIAAYASTAMTAGAKSTRELERSAAAAERLKGQLAPIGKGAAAIGGIAFVATGAADSLDLANTASLALAGAMIGGAPGAAAGGLVGAVVDFRAAVSQGDSALSTLRSTMSETSDLAKTEQDFATLSTEIQNTSESASTFRKGLLAIPIAGAYLAGGSDDYFTDKISELKEGTSEAGRARDAFRELAKATTGETQEMPFFAKFLPTIRDAVPLTESITRVATAARPAMEALGISIEDLANADPSQLAAYVDQIRNFNAGADSMQGRTDALSAAIDGLDDEMMTTADSAKALSDALDALLNPQLNLSQATDAWTTALRHLDDDLAKNSKTLSGNSDAAIQNRAAIRSRVGAMTDVLKAEAAAGAGAGKLSRILQQQRGDLIAAGRAAGISEKDMRTYLRTLGLTPKLVNTIIKNNAPASEKDVNSLQDALNKVGSFFGRPKISVDPGNSMGTINSVAAALRAINGTSATTYVRTIRLGAAAGAAAGALGNAAGGYIRGPGTTTSDSIPAMLSDREFVVRAKAVDHYGPELLHRINTLSFADGGQARAIRSTPFNARDTYARTSTARLAADADFAGRKMREFGSGVERGEKGLKAELKARERLLQKAVEREEKEASAAKERLEAIRQEAQSMRESVVARSRSDLFQQSSSNVTLDRPEGYDQWSIAQQQSYAMLEYSLNRPANPLDVLRGDIKAGKLEQQQIRDLDKILGDSALQYLIDSDNVGAAAGMSERELRQLNRLYNQRERVVGDLGNTAASAIYRKAEAEALKESREQTAELRAVKQELNRLNRRQERLEKIAKDAPKETGKEVGDRVNSAMVKGNRGR